MVRNGATSWSGPLQRRQWKRAADGGARGRGRSAATAAGSRGRMVRDAASPVAVVQRASESLSVSLRSRRAVVVRRARVKWCLRDEVVAGATVAGRGGGLRPGPRLHPSDGRATHHATGLRPARPQLQREQEYRQRSPRGPHHQRRWAVQRLSAEL